MICWNCRKPAPADAGEVLCLHCGERLEPDPEQALQACQHIQFLLKETERWESAPVRWRRELQAKYRARLAHLEPLCQAQEPPRPSLLAPVAEAPTTAQEAAAIPQEARDVAEGPPSPSEGGGGGWGNEASVEPVEPVAARPPQPTPRTGIHRPVVAPSDAKQSPQASKPGHQRLPAEELSVEEWLASGRPKEARQRARESAPQAAPSLGEGGPLPHSELQSQAWPEPRAPVDPGESLDDLRQVLAEKNVSGLMMLGACLLLAAYIGFLRAYWEEGIGKQLAALSMVISPAFFFGFAHWLRDRLPQSSRMMSVLGGILLPIGLLTVNHFHVLGLDLPSQIWSPLSFIISAALLLFQAYRLPEVACLYLAVLSAFLAGLTTGNNFLLALCSFGGAAAILYFHSQSTSPDFKPHYQRISHLLAAGGLLSGVMRTQQSFESSATVFLVGAVYYAGSAYLGRSVYALWVSAVSGLVGFWALQYLLHLSSPMLGLCSLLQGSFYLSRGKSLMESEDEEEKALGAVSYFLGVALTGAVLCLTLGSALIVGVWDNFAKYSAAEQALCIFTGALGFVYYTVAAYYYRKPSLLYMSAASFAYGYFVLAVVVWQAPGLSRFLLVLLPLAWQFAVLSLRSVVPRDYLTPWIISSSVLAALVLPLNVAAQVTHPSPYDLWLYLAGASIFLGAALWQGDGAFLYPGLLSVVVAYTTFLLIQPPHEVKPNVGVLYFPLVGALAALAWWLDRRQQRDFALPLARTSLAMALLFSLIQPVFFFEHKYAYTTLPLVLYGLGFLVAGLMFATWSFLTTPFAQFAYGWSSLCLLSALAAGDAMGETGIGIALVLCVLGVVLGAFQGRAGSSGAWHTWCRAQIPAGLLWSLAPTVFGPAHLALGGALVWALPALLVPVVEDAPVEGEPLTDSNLPRQWVWAALTATLLGFLGAARVNFAPSACLGLLGLAAIQLAVSWRWTDGPANLCALVSTVLGVGGLVRGEPHDVLFPSWWLVQLVFGGYAFACRASRPAIYQVAQASAKVLGVGILIVLPHDGWGCVTALLYGTFYSVAGVMAGSKFEFKAGSLLLGWSLFLAQVHLHCDASTAALAWAGLAWLYLGLSAVLPLMRGFCLQFGPALTILTWLFAGFLERGQGVPALTLAAALWAVRGLMVPEWVGGEEGTAQDPTLTPLGPYNYHVAFAFVYTAWLQVMPKGLPVEAWTAPVGLWFLLWTELLRGSSHPTSSAWRHVGLALLLVPSVVLSVASGTHLTYALVFGVMALGLGTVLSQQVYMSSGIGGVLITVAIQALIVAVAFPWYVWALGAAVLIISLALYTDYRRKKQIPID